MFVYYLILCVCYGLVSVLSPTLSLPLRSSFCAQICCLSPVVSLLSPTFSSFLFYFNFLQHLSSLLLITSMFPSFCSSCFSSSFSSSGLQSARGPIQVADAESFVSAASRPSVTGQRPPGRLPYR